jgi:hypothetical protein
MTEASLLAAPTTRVVDIDISSITGPFEMEVQLWSSSGSWAWMDNIVSGTEGVDFETGTLEGFDTSLNPVSVNVVGGNVNGSGAYVLEIAEDAAWNTITFRSFLAPTSLTLSFDMLTDLRDSDELLVSILDPDTGDGLLEGLEGYGDVLRIYADDIDSSDDVTAMVVPVPGAMVLGLIGVGLVRARVRRSS